MDTDDEANVDKYQARFTWLKDQRLLQDLERDSVDTDLLEEELRYLSEEEPLSNRHRAVKFLQSNPVQILLCILVLLDAGIVVAQILLDLHSVRAKLQKKAEDIDQLVLLVKSRHPEELGGYKGKDVAVILSLLSSPGHWQTSTSVNSNIDNGRSINNIMQTSTASGIAYKPPGNNDTSEGGHYGILSDGTLRTSVSAGSDQIVNLSDANNRVLVKRRVVGHKMDNYTEREKVDTLHELAHGLHFASIAILGFLVVVDLVKMAVMGKSFFKHKIEIFDAVIITVSLVSDIVFLGGMTGEEGEKAAAVLIVLLLWRIMRLVDGFIITAKQRQELRVRLQKRARRRAERRIDILEDERHGRQKQITALKELCQKGGIGDEEIEACTPKRPRRVSQTMSALNSVARLSVSMTMSMSSGLYSMADEDQNRDDDDIYGDQDLGAEIAKIVRRCSTGRTAMSDIEEETSAAGSSSRGQDTPEEPENVTGVRIVIEPGPDLPEAEMDYTPLSSSNLLPMKAGLSDSEPEQGSRITSPGGKYYRTWRTDSSSSAAELLV